MTQIIRVIDECKAVLAVSDLIDKHSDSAIVRQLVIERGAAFTKLLDTAESDTTVSKPIVKWAGREMTYNGKTFLCGINIDQKMLRSLVEPTIGETKSVFNFFHNEVFDQKCKESKLSDVAVMSLAKIDFGQLKSWRSHSNGVTKGNLLKLAQILDCEWEDLCVRIPKADFVSMSR